jgi:molecular chaperone DnaK
MPNTSDPIIGIDLGTTNSAVAVVTKTKIEIIPVQGDPTMPSAVGLDPQGRFIVGKAAKNQAVSAPENTILSIKRLMGTDETTTLGDRTYRPEEVSAIILRELKLAAEAHLGVPVTRAVITVPAFFNERQRQATQDAGRLAGLEVMRIINEPTAAALAYGAGEPGRGAENILVYDLGGGTFDVSLVSVENNVVEVRASHGDTKLGGDDFDTALTNAAVERFLMQENTSGDSITPATRRRLKAVMEEAKITLSDHEFANVNEDYITPSAHLVTEFTRSEYEILIDPWLKKTFECMQRALSDAGLTASQVDKVMLVGGATRTPLVQQLIEEKLRKRAQHEINPDLIVAMGAAVQGAALAGKPSPAILVDISAHTYSTQSVDYSSLFGDRYLICSPIIRRGTPLPTRKSKVFVTMQDEQESVVATVFQGEDTRPEGNLSLGEFRMEGLAKVPRGNEVVIEFQIDLNGMLHATTTEKMTGLSKSLTIDTKGQHRLNLDAARINLAAIFEDDLDDTDEEDGDETENAPVLALPGPKGATPSRAILASAKNLRQRALKTLEGRISETDAHSIRELLESLSTAISSADWESLQTHQDKLSDILFYLED